MDTLKTHKDTLTPVIVKLSTCRLAQEYFPLTSRVTLIFKAGDRLEVASYRPISIIPSVSKDL